MNELEMVARLGAADAAVDALDKEIEALERRVPAAEGELASAVTTRESASKALAAARAEEKKLDADVAAARQRKASAERALDHGLGDPRAVQHQVTTSTAQIETLESRQLEILGQIETLSSSAALAETAWKVAKSRLEESRSATAPLLATAREKRKAAAAAREEAWVPIPRELQGRYSVVRNKRRTAITASVNGYCTQCSVAIPRQDLIDLDKGLLRACPGCSRYIVSR